MHAQRGYHYASPLQATQHNWPTKPTAAEAATAVADVTCKQQVNLTNTWLTVEAAYQTALIGQNIGTLANLQASFQGALNRVEALLASPAGQPSAEVGGRGHPACRRRRTLRAKQVDLRPCHGTSGLAGPEATVLARCPA